MKIYKTVRGLQRTLDKEKKAGRSIGFVPTMGALHTGHISIVEASQQKCDVTVVSIFVNPTQFNDKSDLKKYPRTLDKDAALLKTHGCDYLFAPSAKEVYPNGPLESVDVDISSLTQYMEGPNRPGHFEGVVQVVHRLLDIVKPHKLFMGQKDFQQFSIIDHMLRSLKMKTKLVVCPIKREPDGLAMSSRNVRLDKKLRPHCKVIFETLTFVKENLDKFKPQTLEKKAIEKLSIKGFKPEYIKIVDGKTLAPIKDSKAHKYIVACTAVWAKNVRLIDNMILKKTR